MKKVILGVLGLIIIGAGYYFISPFFRTIELDEAKPEGVDRIVAETAFVPEDHDVEGKALLIEKDGEFIVRFEDFNTVNGPDLDIYLSADLEAEDYINLGDIRATKGSANYEVPAGTDIEKYNKVLVWCEDFSVLFSFADFSS